MARLKVHGRVHLAKDEKVTDVKFVRCPEDARWAPLEGCRRCERCEGVEGESVTCHREGDGEASANPESAPISEVMDPSVLCVDGTASAESVQRAMAEQGTPIAIVVDGSRHPIGVCSRSDLAQRAPSRRVETCMTPFVITMLDKTTVADVLVLMVERDLHHVPVLSEGHVVGIVTQRAVIRWLAQNLREAQASRGPRHRPRANPE
jgi:CBS domain-containing protein